MGWMDTPLGGAFVSLLLGLLLGLERERAKKAQPLFAGIRTLPLIALCGFFAATAGQKGMPMALPALLLAVAAFGLASYLRAPEPDAGITTEMAALVAALLGAVVAWGQVPVAASAAVVVTLLLTLKAPLHRMAGRVSSEEILAIVKFGIVAVVVLPLLPDEPIGPYGALVPRKVGLMVVILSGVSLVGYLLVRILGGRAGWALAGALGGLVIFAVVIVLARVAQHELGTTGLWAVGLVGGLVDVDSIAVAAARLRQQDLATLEVAGGAYLLATVSNLAFKGAAVALTAGAEMARRVLPAFAVLALVTVAALFVG